VQRVRIEHGGHLQWCDVGLDPRRPGLDGHQALAGVEGQQHVLRREWPLDQARHEISERFTIPAAIEKLGQQRHVGNCDRLVVARGRRIHLPVTFVQPPDTGAQACERIVAAVALDVPEPDRQMRGMRPRLRRDGAGLEPRAEADRVIAEPGERLRLDEAAIGLRETKLATGILAEERLMVGQR